MKIARAVLASPSWRSRHSSLWATLLVVVGCGSSTPGGTGGKVTSVTVAGPASVTSGLRFRLTATGKAKHRRAGTSHLAFRKTHKQKRKLRGTGVVSGVEAQRIRLALCGDSY